MSDRDRSSRDDRLLKGALSRSLQTPADDCLDAEALAAWSDRTLSTDEAARVEAHLSSCSRCQAMLAVLVESEPAVAGAAPFGQRWHLRWLVPAVAGAAAVLVWMIVPTRRTDIQPAQTMARAEPQSAPSATAPPSALTERVEKPLQRDLAGEALSQPQIEPRPNTAAGRPAERADAAAAPSSSRGNAARSAQSNDEPRLEAARPMTVPAAPPPPPPPPSATAAPAARTAAAAEIAAPATTSALAKSSAAPVIISVTPVAAVIDQLGDANSRIADSRAGGGRAGAGGRPMAAAPPARAEPPSAREGFSGPQWRIVGGTRVERSTDGSTWQPISIDPPVPLTSGFAPSPLVCWLIGPNGAVFRAMNGVTFVHVTFPEVADLASIRATADGQSATVVTADGRTFDTTNGGASWRRTR